MRRIALLASFAVMMVTASPAQAAVTIESFTAETASTVAGAHSDGTVRVAFQTTLDAGRGSLTSTGGAMRDATVKLPPGLIGIAQNVPQCPVTTFRALGCSPATQIGSGNVVASINGFHPEGFNAQLPQAPGEADYGVQVYNLATSPNQAVVVGLQVDAFSTLGQALITATTHAADGYAVTLSALETPRIGGPVLAVNLTLWAVPADPSHDAQRTCGQAYGPYYGNNALDNNITTGWPNCPGLEGVAVRPALLPFVENPTDCSTAPLTTFTANTYEEPEVFTTGTFTSPLPTGCQTVPFAPSLTVIPDEQKAGVPTGLGVDVSTPQSQDPNGQGTSEVKQIVVTLPQGMVISPSAVSDGLQGCTDVQFGAGSDGPATCPEKSQVGTVEVITQLLSGPLTGKVYLGVPLNDDPTSGQMFRIFLELKGFGQDIKLPGSVTADPTTGQLTATFANLPELPFEEVKLHLNGGPNATVVNPSSCGQNTTTTAISPYSDPTAPATPSSTFTTSYDGNGEPCPASLPFSPSASLSTASDRAGVLSPVSVSFARGDGEQPLGRISAHLPPGLLGYVSRVPLCDPADAAAGTCMPESRIGAVSATAGPGSDPLTVPGTVYLAQGTGGYPFALSVVVPAVAGPYDLGNVVVLVNLEVNDDGSLTASSGPLPSIIDGVPLDVRGFTLTIDRPGFTFNPTNCSLLSMGGSASSLSGTVAAISVPFQVSGCGSLPFKPSFTVATLGSTSKANGASLTVRVAQQPGEANIRAVKVELPRVLPSRLTTLQKACPEAVFYANPAGCAPQSIVGTAVVSTPVLSVELRGPAYFVSHGGAKFPELIIVLQGEGITIELAGETFISKAGVTSSTFNAVPDVPIDAFELNLPEGPYSALAANGTLCASAPLMPTTITGQNGVVVKQVTRIAVSGCPKVKVVSAKIKGATALITVRASAAGRLVVSGLGLKQVSRILKRAGNAMVEVGLSRSGLVSMREHRGKLKVKLKAALMPSEGSGSFISTTLTFR
jgi:hypothetical protein